MKTAHQSKDLQGCDTASEALNKAWEAASQDIYSAQQNAQGAQSAETNNNSETGGNNDGNNVEDVSYEEVK